MPQRLTFLSIQMDPHPWGFQTERIINKAEVLELNVIDFPDQNYFAVIQVHSKEFNLTLSYNATLTQDFYTVGKNLGLILEDPGSLFVSNSGPNVDIAILITAVLYMNDVPVPGGCNMEFETEYAPYIKITTNQAMAKVEAAPASNINLLCEKSKISYNIYYRYLPTQDFSEKTYFASLISMMTIDEIYTNGKDSMQSPGPPLKRLFSSYPGNGVVYTAVASNRNGDSGESAYVPAITYFCSTVYLNNSCDVLNTPLSKVLCAFSLFVGLFLCFFGHQYFRTQMFLTGGLCGGLLGYIIGELIHLDSHGVIICAIFGGMCLGFAWLGLWGVVGYPIISVLASTMILGYIAACVLLGTVLADIYLFQSDVNYWSVFLCMNLFTAMSLLGLANWGSILFCGILGGYSSIIPIDYYLGGHLKYLVINNIRRATVPEFNHAVIDIPFQIIDMCLVALWFALAVSGILVQWHNARGRPPFPASPRELNEHTPLIVRIPIGRGDDDVFESPDHVDGCCARLLRRPVA